MNDGIAMKPMPYFDVVTFGETMIRLSPPGYERLEAADTLDFRIGGSESNTAVALARLGRRVSWWSRLVDNPLGRKIAGQMARWGVDTSYVIWTNTGRVGVYYIEFGMPPRPHHVHYDRAHSAVSELSPDQVDWSHLDNARHLHVSGITTALSASCAETVARAVKEAKERGLSVSFDVNFRRKLWSAAQCRETIVPLLAKVNLLFCPMGDAEEVFGFADTPERVARAFQENYGVPTVVVTGSRERVEAVDGDRRLFTPVIPAREVDRIGSGDAGNAGILHGYLDGDLAKGLRYGAAMAALKHSIPGDELIATREEIEAIVNGAFVNIQR